MAHNAPARPTDQVDYMIGLVGGVGGILLIITIVMELTGQPALAWALALLVTVVGTALLVRHRARILRRMREAEAPDAVENV